MFEGICSLYVEYTGQMKKDQTAREVQRVAFVENLYKNLKRQTKAALDESHRWTKVASSYLDDGMEVEEAIELLMIDGLTREAATGYLNLAHSTNADCDEYMFQFEDTTGTVWNSSDIGKVIMASSDQDAWKKAEEIVFSEVTDCDPERIVSVTKI